MRKILFPSLAGIVLLAACVPSVNPFYTEKDVITDPRITGLWREDEEKENPATWKFDATTNNAYAVVVTEDKDKTGKFEGHLFTLGKEFFLDLAPTECNYATNQAGMVGVAMIPGHLLLRVIFKEDKLNFALCNPDWIEKYLATSPSAIAHRKVDDGIILTAETRALQKFVLKHLGKDELFSAGADFRRQADGAGAK